MYWILIFSLRLYSPSDSGLCGPPFLSHVIWFACFGCADLFSPLRAWVHMNFRPFTGDSVIGEMILLHLSINSKTFLLPMGQTQNRWSETRSIRGGWWAPQWEGGQWSPWLRGWFLSPVSLDSQVPLIWGVIAQAISSLLASVSFICKIGFLWRVIEKIYTKCLSNYLVLKVVTFIFITSIACGEPCSLLNLACTPISGLRATPICL
jgi:hypothetical protein